MPAFSWDLHEPHKEVGLTGPMKVTCKCGWKSTNGKGYSMDQYRAHVSALMPKHDDIPPKPTSLDKRVSMNHSTKRRWK